VPTMIAAKKSGSWKARGVSSMQVLRSRISRCASSPGLRRVPAGVVFASAWECRGLGDPGGAAAARAAATMYNRAMPRQDDMQPARSSPVKFTYADYVNFPDDGRRHELIDGEHFVTPSPERRHQQLSGRLFAALAAYLPQNPVGEVYAAPLDVILSDSDVVQPDILYVSKERSQILGRWVHGAPDLVVEILSPATRKVDEAIKRRLYDRVNVRQYWIVDLELDSVKVYRRSDDGGFPRVAELARESDDVLSTPLLPGFRVRLAEVFE
jgi:Uma2 family endonuclease